MRAVAGSENAHGNMCKTESHDTIPTTALLDKYHDITTAASRAEDAESTDFEQIITVTTTTSRKVCLHTQITLPFFHLSVDTIKIFLDPRSIKNLHQYSCYISIYI